jgi:hypothetical protein
MGPNVLYAAISGRSMNVPFATDSRLIYTPDQTQVSPCDMHEPL